jgi:DNA-binding beta-propeller fold protein YncE
MGRRVSRRRDGFLKLVARDRGALRPGGVVGRLVGVCAAVACALAVVPVVADAAPSAVYVPTVESISQFGVGAGGALSPLAPDIGGLFGGTAAAISPDSRSVYVTNSFTSPGLLQFSVSATGVLAPMTVPGVATGGFPIAVAVSPDGHSVYVADQGSGQVSQYTVGAGGALTAMTTPNLDSGSEPTGVAVSPDGRSVYVTYADGVAQFTVGAGGALTPMATPTIAVSGSPQAIAVRPDGHSAYVANQTNGVSQFTIGAGGALTAMATPTVPGAEDKVGIAVSPDGHSVYSSSLETGGVSQYTVGAGGALTPMTPATVAGPDGGPGMAVSPDGHSVYVTDAFSESGSDGVAQYDAGPGGALTPKTPATVTTGGNPWGLAITPDQAPVASFSTTGMATSSSVSFDGSGSASTASDGTIASYAWSFGDGSTQTTTTPQVKHAYTQPGTYTATLTVTDQAGCSTTVVFTGQTASCNGGPTATTTHHVIVVGPPAVSITTPADGSTYTQGQAVNAAYTCADSSNGPGLKPGTAGCSGTVANGSAINTATTGTQAFSVTATSTDGQTTTHTVHYTIVAAAKAPTTIRPAPQVAIPALSGVGLLHVSATLTTNNTPLAGKTVAFTAGKTKLCSAQTNTKGVAACQINVLQEVVVLLNNSYTASFSGDTAYTASTASTPAISITLLHGQARAAGHVAHHQTALHALAYAHGHHARQLRARVKQILNHKHP